MRVVICYHSHAHVLTHQNHIVCVVSLIRNGSMLGGVRCGRMTQFTANICAKDTATRATRNMFPENGRQCVCDVFDVAVKDLAPFDVEEDAKNVAFWKAGYGGGGVSRKGPSPPPPARQPSVFVEKQQPQQSSPLFPPPRWSDR